MNIGDRIKEERERKGWTQDELAFRCGYKHRSAISKIESSGDEVSSKKVRLMANVLGTTVSYLMGWEEQAKAVRSILEEKAKAMPDSSLLNEEFQHPIPDQTKIPLYSYVSAGRGALTSDSNIEGYVSLSNELVGTGDYFALRVRGDSMEPTICDRDIVIVRSQETANDGDTVVAVVNGDEGFVKRLMIEPSGIVLASNNSSYRPMFFSQEQINELPVRIEGVVVELRRTF